MQIIGFILVTFWEKIPFLNSTGDAVRFTFLLVGIWWIGFAQITFHHLPNGKPLAPAAAKKEFYKGWIQRIKKGFFTAYEIAGSQKIFDCVFLL